MPDASFLLYKQSHSFSEQYYPRYSIKGTKEVAAIIEGVETRGHQFLVILKTGEELPRPFYMRVGFALHGQLIMMEMNAFMDICVGIGRLIKPQRHVGRTKEGQCVFGLIDFQDNRLLFLCLISDCLRG